MTNVRISSQDYGLNTHNFPNGFESDEQLKDLLVNLGVKWLRAEVTWFEIEKKEGQFDYRPVNTIVDFAQEYEINLLFVLARTPEFYCGGPGHNHLPEKYKEQWQLFVRKTIEKYNGFIKHWNIWNEPHLPQFWEDTQKDFIERVLWPAVETIRSIDPKAKICGPELSSSNNNIAGKQWLKAITESGIRFDILTHHQYDYDDYPEMRYQEVINYYNYAKELGYNDGTPLWITETGWPYPNFTYQKIAENLEVMMEKIKKPDGGEMLEKIFWYCFRDPSSGPTYGLLDLQNKPTAVYKKYKEIITNETGTVHVTV